ncbi:UDP-N-acetylmuramate:L-alanyl-gamma-D-glutamyl-meso-diaminopimelate ligase [Akkermansiaceae bacterium]|nr:UDP-N-acetylmuramate:L-alanyl-gamma-D-glutamyl-meso-diaminopimelate ligase [Akkermansiaceae bacterium]MDB4299368.1 UDP-N-acetylmuramate:L-alanyl-gamma-D-glutamyl-meso-diaminopimelate ligase [bacterium]MDB0056090.1 UDP-N-acetylmuramate:L-alanyl-gamma-D-glutamyl-meso-diaminopimelate ligase [Akkermansiaceae bacterium]MDB0067844.1 UDP-N-acetylmuramate:L-alanyl-gamma-D-glutamyl-meso-diaminopimelate ligase [Akkermansiaceae bacterium]MDB4257983.1 UDP-N-acetylmuramate:L-alanyl-gamma-D-glutamyl-meso-
MKDEQFHFIGVCGTAMGSVAAGMAEQGYKVTGSDQAAYPPMSDFLAEKGITICEGYRAENIPDEATTVVIGNAISRGNDEAEAVLDRRLRYQSLPEVLKEHFLRGHRNLVISGTHGKTTTSSMLAWILESAGKNPSFMIGGIPRNFGQGARFTDSEFVVMEGDEYDTAFFDKRSKFLHYLPEVVVINNIEFDHADIFDSLDQIKLSFERQLRVVPRNGLALVNGDDQNCLDVSKDAHCPVKTVGFGENCELRITNVSYLGKTTRFDLGGDTYEIPMVGEFNVRNAAMALCSAKFAEISVSEIQKGLASFSGIARRQEERGEVRGVTVVDDFAHHPTAIAQAIKGLRQRYDGRRLWVLFEPRSNTTRRNIFQQDLAEALSEADLVVLPSIPDPEKVAEEDRLDPEKLVADIKSTGTEAWYLGEVDEIVTHVTCLAVEGDVIVVLSNGGFGGIHPKLLAALEE